MADSVEKNWRVLCVAVTNERDATKLSALVEELIEAFDNSEPSWLYACPSSDALKRDESVGVILKQNSEWRMNKDIVKEVVAN
jgi:hypothetical protein